MKIKLNILNKKIVCSSLTSPKRKEIALNSKIKNNFLQKVYGLEVFEGVPPDALDLVRVQEKQLERGQPVEHLSRQARNSIAVKNTKIK